MGLICSHTIKYHVRISLRLVFIISDKAHDQSFGSIRIFLENDIDAGYASELLNGDRGEIV
jgi:hypothetical protein